MNIRVAGFRAALAVATVGSLLIAGCASNSQEMAGPSTEYEQSTARSEVPKCPSGYVLQCETKRVGRIRFNSIGRDNLESCSCEEYQGMPTQSPLPGIQ